MDPNKDNTQTIKTESPVQPKVQVEPVQPAKSVQSVEPPPVQSVEPPTSSPSVMSQPENVSVGMPPPINMSPPTPNDPAPMAAVMTPPPHKTSKLLVVLLVIFGIVLAALVYVFINQSALMQSGQSYVTPIQTRAVVVTPSPTPTPSDAQAVQNVDVSDVTSDINSVKTDMKGL